VDVLKIEGKSCSQSERKLQRGDALTECNVEMLDLPRNEEKRHSLYDLQQILTLLQKEDLKRQASNTASSSRNASATSNASGREPSESVYDLREEKDGRKGSVYDLMEFLTLGNSSETGSGSTSENSSRSTSPRILSSPHASSSSNNLLSVSVANNGEESRRASTYDLMEFLSLPRSGGNSRPDSGPSRPALHEEGSSAAESKMSDSVTEKFKEKRSLSMYDLEEFLSMTSDIPPLVRVTPWEEEQKTNSSKTVSDSEEGAKRDLQQPRGSVYDLSEILSVLQQENEKRHESASNLRQMLGYSTGSDQAASTDAPKNMDVTENSRHMSVYDLREFLSIYAAQQNPSATHQQQLSSAVSLRRKFSGVSQSGVSILVTDESNRSIDSEFYEDVFLPVPSTEPSGASDPSRKRSSIYDLREFLSILNADESPLRRRLSSVPQLFPRQDSGGSLSLYDLGEFLSLLNTEESPLRRRLSSVNDKISAQGEEGARTPVLSRSDSEKGLYSLEEILTVMNELEQRNSSENMSGDIEGNVGEEISIQVPTLLPKAD
ncbi:unnamed protein product, partial [Pocillopora meandrina]